MMKIKLAKSLMENEEGTNHLWIKIPTIVSLTAKHVQISIHLPKGLYRLKNLNGYYEDKSGTIFIDDFSKKDDLIVEIFTKFNLRAIHLYEKLGFVKKDEFSTDFAEFMTMVKKTNYK